jgi:hypothetical protein
VWSRKKRTQSRRVAEGGTGNGRRVSRRLCIFAPLRPLSPPSAGPTPLSRPQTKISLSYSPPLRRLPCRESRSKPKSRSAPWESRTIIPSAPIHPPPKPFPPPKNNPSARGDNHGMVRSKSGHQWLLHMRKDQKTGVGFPVESVYPELSLRLAPRATDVRGGA